MNIVLISMLQLHKYSGSARTVLENIRYYKMKGFKVHVASITLDNSFIQDQGAIPHKLIPWFKSTGFWRRKWYNWQFEQLKKKLKPSLTIGHGDIRDQDILHLHNCVFYASELIHGKILDRNSEMALAHRPLLTERKFKLLIANSKLMKEDLIKRFKIAPEKIEVIYPSLDTSVFFSKTEQKKELRKRFNFPDKVIVSLVTSGNFKKRGLDLFIEAVGSLPHEVKQLADFRVVGKDRFKNTPHITYDSEIRDIQNYFNAIDIFVLPARIEEFGRVVLEAMGCGLPVITTDKVGASELLKGESKEFVIPSHDVNELSIALQKLILDPNLRKTLGELNNKLAQAEAENKLYAKMDSALKHIIHLRP